MEYVSTAKWRERRWRLFSTFPVLLFFYSALCHAVKCGEGRWLFPEDLYPGVFPEYPQIKERPEPPMIQAQRPKISITEIAENKETSH